MQLESKYGFIGMLVLLNPSASNDKPKKVEVDSKCVLKIRFGR